MPFSPRATGRNMEQFQVSVSVAPNAKITFELVYEELLKRCLGVYELLLKVRPQQLVKHLQVPAVASSGEASYMTVALLRTAPLCPWASCEPQPRLLADPGTHILPPDGHSYLRAPGHQLPGDREHLHDQPAGRCPHHLAE